GLYDNSSIGNQCTSLPPTVMIVSRRKTNSNNDEIIENDEEDYELPVYSTETPVVLESDSFLIWKLVDIYILIGNRHYGTVIQKRK
ncbi:unnamed protein product, partial [Rotaria magnacalcarata]